MRPYVPMGIRLNIPNKWIHFILESKCEIKLHTEQLDKQGQACKLKIKIPSLMEVGGFKKKWFAILNYVSLTVNTCPFPSY